VNEDDAIANLDNINNAETTDTINAKRAKHQEDAALRHHLLAATYQCLQALLHQK
jgi:hypothetical protein